MTSHIHRTHRSGWLRAAVLGANDGLLSLSSLMVGVAAAQTHPRGILTAGVAGLAAGMLSMGAGEYVSVSSQADIEHADIEIERLALKSDYAQEQAELARIYVRRGLDPALARQVAEQLMAYDALAAHMRDDIGISDALAAQPILAALTSSVSFAIGGAGPLLAAFTVPESSLIAIVVAVSLVFLTALGIAAARLGGAPIIPGTLRVLTWGAVAMAGTGLVGALFGAVV
jgi:vacuolar iron transporter family protein